MLREFGIVDSNIFKVIVMATMSSGKSTFINALIGDDILPAKNEACTARIVPFIDNDVVEGYKVYVRYKNGKKDIVKINDSSVISRFNESEDIENLVIEGNIEGIRNSQRASVLIDTPGVNFSNDESHKMITYKFLEKLDSGLILYIINATQFGINDDENLLKDVVRKISNSSGDIKILFVVNKIDELDFEKESIKSLMKEVKKYIVQNGIENPEIIPVSSLAAKLFRKALKGKDLTRREARAFEGFYEDFESRDFDLRNYMITSYHGINSKTISVNETEYKRLNVIRAIENTGFNLIEDYIEECMILKEIKFNPQISLEKDNTVSIEGLEKSFFRNRFKKDN